MNFVKASLKYRQVTIPVLLLMFILGVNSLINMPRREDPKIIIPGGLVLAYYPGANALQVEEQVTSKIEEYLFQFEEVNRAKTFSETSDGMVVVHVWLQDDVRKPDIFWNFLNTKEQVNRDIAKSYRRLKQSEELIKVAGKVVEYRREDLKIQSDRRKSGLNLEADLLAAKAALAKSEADLYAAQLNYRIALSELKILTGSY